MIGPKGLHFNGDAETDSDSEVDFDSGTNSDSGTGQNSITNLDFDSRADSGPIFGCKLHTLMLRQ